MDRVGHVCLLSATGKVKFGGNNNRPISTLWYRGRVSQLVSDDTDTSRYHEYRTIPDTGIVRSLTELSKYHSLIQSKYIWQPHAVSLRSSTKYIPRSSYILLPFVRFTPFTSHIRQHLNAFYIAPINLSKQNSLTFPVLQLYNRNLNMLI
jgi:hypothetical protein